MVDHELREAVPDDAGVVARLLHDFNTEFEAPTPSVEEFEAPIHDELPRLGGDSGTEPLGTEPL